MPSPAVDPILTPEMLDNHVGIMGKTGSGKSNVAKLAVEGLLDAGERVCIIDPTGSWFGLRLMPDLTPSPYEIVMFGGEHADVAISGAHGNAIAEIIATSSTPAIIDTQTMSVGARTAFFADFAQRLFEKNRGNLHLVIDEAHLFAPKGRVADIKSGEMLHAANNLASLGRGRGLRMIFLSQRPAKLHNDSLTQIETLVAMRLVAHWDVDAIEDWVKSTAADAGKEMIATLPKLKTGSGWLWSPGLDVFCQFDAPLVKTLDTGKPSDQVYELAPIDVGAVSARLDEIEEAAVANEPRTLKARIKELEAQLARKAGPAFGEVLIQEKIVYRDVVPQALQDEIEAALQVMREGTATIENANNTISSAVQRTKLRALLHEATPVVTEPEASAHGQVALPAKPLVTRPGAASPAAATPAGPSDLGHQILRSLADAPEGRPLRQIALMTVYSPNGGFFRRAVAQLKAQGLIEVGGTVRLLESSEGMDPIPMGPPLLQRWIDSGRLDGASAQIVQKLAEFDRDVTIGELATSMGYSANGGWFRRGIKKARTMGLVNGLLELGLAEELVA